jgi:hypothetical protein
VRFSIPFGASHVPKNENELKSRLRYVFDFITISINLSGASSFSDKPEIGMTVPLSSTTSIDVIDEIVSFDSATASYTFFSSVAIIVST